MNKKKLTLGLVFGILFVAYNLILFLVNPATNYFISFWLSFGFIVVSFIFLVFAYLFVSDDKRKHQVVGMPVGVMTTLYFAVEFVLGTILMCFNISFAASFIPQFVLFVLYLICFVPAILSENNYKEETATPTLKEMKDEIHNSVKTEMSVKENDDYKKPTETETK